MNAQELVEITQQVHDPDEGFRLMSEANREAGRQTHREVSRRVHNFAVSALTLVEHTRIFMRQHYGATAILDRYEATAKAEFASDPVSQFVQKLRNYMVHKGLPNSEMFLEMKQDPRTGEGATLITGVRLRAESLLGWDGWGEVARRYIEASGEYVDIRSFADDYTNRVVAFHAWLQSELDQHHSADLADLRRLQAELKLAENGITQSESRPVQTELQPGALSEEVSKKIRERSRALLGKIRRLELSRSDDPQFKSQRPVSVTLTDADVIGTPLLWAHDVDGCRVFAFLANQDGVFGLDEVSYLEIRPLVEDVLKLPWAANALSRSFIEKTTVNWLQASFGQQVPTSLETFLGTKAERVVKPLSLWAPVAHFEVEAPFSLGPVAVRPITANLVGELEARFIEAHPDDADQVRQLFGKIRSRIQGLAAIVVEMTGDPERLEEQGAEIAKAAVGLLRFLSPAAANPTITSGVALLGMDLVPSRHLMVMGDEAFSYSERMLIEGTPAMQIPEAAFGKLNNAFEALGALVRPEGLSQFAFTVRACLLLFTTGITLSDPLDRLTYSVSAMEKLLLRHSAEASKFNVAERMRLILSQGSDADDDVARTAREAYRLLARRDLSPLAPYQRDAALSFSLNTYRVLRTALSNLKNFDTVQNFIGSVDQLSQRREH